MKINFRRDDYLYSEESRLLEKLYDNIDIKIKRRSNRLYDLSIEGCRDFGTVKDVNFSAWLPLTAIGELRSADLRRAFSMSDYPEMAGDWSAIRDSEPETIWRIFDKLVLKNQN